MITKRVNINEQIRSLELRVIDDQGKNMGIFSREEALALAREKGTDLIEISSSVKPPIAKLISYDKFRYQQEKESKKQNARHKQGELKQIRITARAAENDLRIKVKQLNDFLEKGYKVEIMLALRGREKANEAWAMERLREFVKMIDPEHKVTVPPRKGGRGIMMQIIKNK